MPAPKLPRIAKIPFESRINVPSVDLRTDSVQVERENIDVEATSSSRFCALFHPLLPQASAQKGQDKQ